MKYGRIVYGKNPFLKGKQTCNLGDVFQTLVFDYFYSLLNISSDKIIDISRYELETYRGEKVLLPMNAWFGHAYKGVGIKYLSKDITPLFLGFHCINKNNIPLMLYKKNVLVGCRDEATLKLLRKENIPCFLSGCMTIAFPFRDCESTAKKIYAVDLPNEIVGKLPFDRKDIVIKNQSIPLKKDMDVNQEHIYCDKKAQKRLKELRDNASIVITSRLHCTIPSLAMGIPVILIREHYDERFQWVEKYLPLYTNKDFDKIHWNIHNPDISEIKKDVLEMALSAIETGNIDTQLAKKVHDFYMDRDKLYYTVAFKLKVYNKVHQYFPNLAEFIRLNLLSSFSMDKKFIGENK